ncbi:unnamed protein product [Danaus chrysippus]|uniref:(African queen) hypothetical protein n=1 Tax=Danaus chrysippus TaxID=151541 RepID=A0A8J2QNM7_9NEOP|nr:unnamed protein product [Danaus chrysippus]
MSSKQTRAASRRRLPTGPSQGQPQGPSQGQTKGPSQGHSRDASASEASRAPSAASLRSVGQTTDYSDTESVMSVSDCGSIRRESRKRFLRQKSGGSPDAARTPAKRAIVEADLEEVVASKEKVTRTTRAKAGYGAPTVRYADHSVEEMERMALEDQGEIVEVASKSSNLKGTFQKALKCRAASLMGIVKELSQRTTSNETRLLQAKVDRLQKEMSALHARIAELMARSEGTSEGPAVAAAPSNLEDIIRKVVMEERAFTKACFAGIEDRLLPEKRLRPPLGRTSTAPPPQEVAPAQKEQPKATKAGKGKGKGKKSPSAPTSQAGASAAPAPAQAPVKEDALLPSTTPSNEPWKKVVGKKQRKGKKPVPESPAANKAPAGKRRKLVPPKTAAVVVTLTAEAVTRGETYESVLRRARANIDPVQPGEGRVTCRRTQTGARIFEFSGAQGSAKADTFANQLKETIADTAKVARPVKCVTLEVTDLDDSVTQEEVVAAVAALGSCDIAAIKGRAIRPGRGGMGSLRLECPVVAAKAVLAKGRLPVGFSSAGVRALEDEPMRCYKCFGIGHTRALCPCDAERTDLCFRCGKGGHKSTACEATKPHCAVCADSGRPADHIMAGRKCRPPLKKGKAQVTTRPAAAAATAIPAPVPATEGNAMNTD